MRSSFFSTANLLSLARVPLALLFTVASMAPRGRFGWAMAVLALAALTDVLDGMFARRAVAAAGHPAPTPADALPDPAGWSATTRPGRGGTGLATPAGTGSWLDPVCDKIFVATVLGTLWVRERPALALLAMILARELAQVPLSLLYVSLPSLRRWLRYDFRASLLGKAATVSQFAAIAALVLRLAWVPMLARISLTMGLLALADYLWRAVRMGRAQLHARSVP